MITIAIVAADTTIPMTSATISSISVKPLSLRMIDPAHVQLPDSSGPKSPYAR